MEPVKDMWNSLSSKLQSFIRTDWKRRLSILFWKPVTCTFPKRKSGHIFIDDIGQISHHLSEQQLPISSGTWPESMSFHPKMSVQIFHCQRLPTGMGYVYVQMGKWQGKHLYLPPRLPFHSQNGHNTLTLHMKNMHERRRNPGWWKELKAIFLM